MTFNTIDHETKGLARLITQYRESDNLKDYLSAFLVQSDELEDTLFDLLEDRTLDEAEGAQLDIIGEIVGRPRTLEEYIAIPYFGFLGAIGAGTFSTLASPSAGELFMKIGDPETIPTELDDATYLKYIRVKIVRNDTDATIEQVIDACLVLTPGVSIEVTELGNAVANIKFHTFLSDSNKLILARTNFLPKPAGVRVGFEDNDGLFA